MSRRSVKSFYSNKISYHRFMQPVIDEIVADDENSSADIILIGPPAGGYETDNEEEDEDAVAETALPNEVSSKMVVIHNNWSDNDEENDNASDHVTNDWYRGLCSSKKGECSFLN